MIKAEAQSSRTRSQHAVQEKKRAASFNSTQGKQTVQQTLVENINNSPFVAAQRKKFESLFAGATQLQNETSQRAENEEALQGKLGAVQRVKDEEPLQGKFGAVQRVEDEEPLQGKFAAAQRVEDEEPLQGKLDAVQRVVDEEPLQAKFNAQASAQLKEEPAATPNNTGLPDNLKNGIESLSGISMESVRVHYNSAQPAQLNALAYAQGTDIHVAPGQEKHLPHEAWHVVQQAQGRVKPTMQMKGGTPVNDDKSLEHEADVMGGKAAQMRSVRLDTAAHADSASAGGADLPIQRFMACYSRSDLNYDDEQTGNWYNETIGSCRYVREGHMVYTLTDGSNTGSIKHYVPSNWISKNLIDHHIIGFKRHEVITRLTAILQGLGLAAPGHDTSRRDGFDAWVSDAVDAISDWEQNLFRDAPSSGDHAGTTLDTPTDGNVLLRVQAARQVLRQWGIGHQAL